MNDQLALLEASAEPRSGPAEPVWALDEHTREVGRRGLAMARSALRQAEARPAA